ncbi:hypothetical protein FQA39_LY03181 [Lamprigera yunnana]|nr:hypothetical protein FQA39_LY03181 [Lamprigera yunnana]
MTFEQTVDDKELIDELQTLVGKVKGSDVELISPALNMLKSIIRSSTTSMTSVPKPLKYLAPHYDAFKAAYNKLTDLNLMQECADVISVLAMCPSVSNTGNEKHDCLHFCLLGTGNIGDWGHEYIRQLENEIVDEWLLLSNPNEILLPLVREIIKFNCKHHAEIQACDMLMEIDRLEILPEYIDDTTYSRICLYLISCVKYVDYIEANKILRLVTDQYLRFNEYTKALILALQLNNKELANRIFSECKNGLVLRQMAFIVTRQQFAIEVDPKIDDHEDILNILNNAQMSTHFLMLARELDVIEPKTTEEVYKTWLEPVPMRPLVLGENLDSARQNLASSFVNGFVNAGFGTDKLMTIEGGNKWIYRTKDKGMMSATATLGLLYLWDVDGGLTPIDKYLYTTEEHIKAGALLALGIVNCRIRNECDPALALLTDFVSSKEDSILTGAVFGLGLAYAGTNREDVLSLLITALENASNIENLAVASLSCGLVAVGSGNSDVVNVILSKLLDAKETEALKSPYMRLVLLGLGICYIGRKDMIEITTETLGVFEEPFHTIAVTLLKMCAYAGTGDVLVIQELLHIVSERLTLPEDKTDKDKKKNKLHWDSGIAQAVAVLAVAAVSLGEETGMEMSHRILGNMGRYGDLWVRRAVPLAVALLSVCRPQLPVINILTKYSHDPDQDVSCNAIFCLGIIGAGTNNARLSAVLRQLAVFHTRNPSQLFMVRLAQGLTHLGKGTLTVNPLHTDRQLLDPCSMAGILIPLVTLFDTHSFVLGHNHYLLFALVAAIYPRWLLTLDEKLEPVFVTVRVGQAVDTVGKAGIPKTIAGIHTHTTPMLLAAGERAELATDQYEQFSPTLDGICILKKKVEASTS